MVRGIHTENTENVIMFNLRKYAARDLLPLTIHLREADKNYILAMTNTMPFIALSNSFADADTAVTIVNEEDTPVAVFAVSGGNVWLQTCNLTDGRALDVIRAGKEILKRLGDAELYCVVPVKDTRVRLLCKAMGFNEQVEFTDNFNGTGIAHVELKRRTN
jgi:hypothetical protein